MRRLLGALAALALVHCGQGATGSSSPEPAVEDSDPNALTWVAPTVDTSIEEQDPVELTLTTQNAGAHVVHFTVDGAEIGVCDPSQPDEDCYDTDNQLWRWTWVATGVGSHTLTVSFTDAQGQTVSATRDVQVLAMGDAPYTDTPESNENDPDPLPSDQQVLDGTQTLDDGTGYIEEGISSTRGYLDPNRGWHNVYGGISWEVQGQRVLLHGTRLDGSVASVARCMQRYGASIRRYADLRYISRASVYATLIAESNCTDPAGSSDGLSSGPAQVTASTCAAITGLSRTTCRLRMHSSPDFSIDVGTRYMASSYQRRQHNNDPPKIAAAYNAGSIRYTRLNHWHMLSTGNHIDRWVAAYNAYRTWENGDSSNPAHSSGSGGASAGGGEVSCSHVQWWNTYITYQHVVSGWNDTDLGVSSSTPVQLRHPSRLTRHGVYAWGYMPEFTDMVTGHHFRLLHLRPQHQFATQVGHIYPAGYIVGLSGGDTRDTGYGIYSTGPHLCVQTQVSWRTAFPSGRDRCN